MKKTKKTKQTKQPQEMTTAELEAMLKERKKAETAAREAEKEEYEKERDEVVLENMEIANKIGKELLKFKTNLHVVFDQHQEKLNAYGGIRGNSKGGFSLIHSSGDFKVTRIRATEPVWDERSTKAVELIKDFLADTIKKKDKKLFEILYSFLERNKEGDLEYAKVMHLYKHRDKYNDQRWIEGLKLLQEAYSVRMRAFRYDFFMKDSNKKWKRIDINFSSL